MRKSDLKNGMIVELRKGKRFVVIGDILYSKDSYISISSLDDNLKSYFSDLDVVKIYNQELMGLDDLLNINCKCPRLIWERKEVDWSNVEFGTRVRVWDKEDSEKLEGVFLEYKPQYKNFPFRAYVKDEEYQEYISWQNCELV